MALKLKTKFVCQSCGYSSPKWSGKCPDCGLWNTMAEEIIDTNKIKNEKSSSLKAKSADIVLLSEIENKGEVRFKTGIEEFDGFRRRDCSRKCGIDRRRPGNREIHIDASGRR